MALETVVFQQEVLSMAGLSWPGYNDFEELECDHKEIKEATFDEWYMDSTPSPEVGKGKEAAVTVPARRKRRRAKVVKNKEEVESQRMNHIAIERNRRKQMNEYLAVLRSLMPPSYVQRGDQASIVGGAINFVKELEQLLQSLEAKKRSTQQASTEIDTVPFADFFTFPQYFCSLTPRSSSCGNFGTEDNAATERKKALADIEVTMVESHANLKLLVRRRPKQLLRIVVSLQNMRLSILHLNASSSDQMVLYSFSLKVEDDCQLTSVDDIATAVHDMVASMLE
ncbi:Basic helix-loop-helix (BHLH) DNA-binding superfamily [Rhynchospora pubera]|uniref:Basic helix-loop-helix (BHLH) DNA-binding superfamily n=1 Tax=Rhynchospora pubera TaxID=906938 RepID=A0AAV8CDD8_9POAL|nr:Basic helix-loop-helix (BHLH) DNA-binding superfamily [Rhynchospora pubera]